MGSLEKTLPHVIILGVLVLVLLFILTQFGFIRCCDVPGFCTVYYAVKGQPKMLILYGNNGIGDPEALANFMKTEMGVYPHMLETSLFSDADALKQYDMVVVDRAKKLSTKQLLALRSYVQQGGTLVWIGDAGTELGDKDYICEKVTFEWWPSVKQQTQAPVKYTCDDVPDATPENPDLYRELCRKNQCSMIDNPDAQQICIYAVQGAVKSTKEEIQEVCAEDIVSETPDHPEGIGAGICGKNFAEVIYWYERIYEQEYKKASEFGLCSQDKEPFRTTGDDRIKLCIQKIREGVGRDVNISKLSLQDLEEYVDQYCEGMTNYWNRGPSYDETSKKILNQGIDFSHDVLGFDYAGTKEVDLRIIPTDPSHPLIRGYEAPVWVNRILNVSLADTYRFSTIPRTHTLMAFSMPQSAGGESWPAVLVSNPLPSPFKRGNIIFYAFAPEELMKGTGKGSNLLRNLADWLYCR